MSHRDRPTRQQFLRFLTGGLTAATAFGQDNGPVFAGKRTMIVHNDFPEDLETPLDAFGSWLTPNDAFFVRQHLPRPEVDIRAWRVEISGLADKPQSLSLDDIRRMRQYIVPATLECTGNGRGYFRPSMPGLLWKKGGIGNAEWRGVRLADLLRLVNVKTGAAFVDVDGADTGVSKTPDFIRSIPMRKALDPATLIALEMNGAPLPEIHGGPMRLVVPGWNGANWVKWVNRLNLVAESNSGFYMNPAYKYPKVPLPPGTAARPEDLAPLERMPVKSFFFSPQPESKHTRGPVSLRGLAWAGERRIARVDVSVDRGLNWKAAELGKEDFPSAWRLFRCDWTPAGAGYHVVMCRATDDAGVTQPIDAAWNPSGYLWNSVDRLGVLVEG